MRTASAASKTARREPESAASGTGAPSSSTTSGVATASPAARRAAAIALKSSHSPWQYPLRNHARETKSTKTFAWRCAQPYTAFQLQRCSASHARPTCSRFAASKRSALYRPKTSASMNTASWRHANRSRT